MIIPNEELKIFKNLSDELNVIVDVGVREDLDYYKHKPFAEYHLFEPEIEFFNKLTEKVSKLNEHNIHLNQVGLSDETVNGVVYYKNTQGFVKHQSVKSIDSGERYDLIKLDDYVSENNIDVIDFLKIDVEGLDYKVVNGGLETLKDKVKYVQIEFNILNGGIKQFVDLLTNFNFYLMVEPQLLNFLEKLKTQSVKDVDFNKSLIKLDENIIKYVDETILPTNAGGNIFGVRKDLLVNNNLFFKII